MYTLIPFPTQPPHECTLTGRGSWVYPNGRGSRVRPGRSRRCARASPLAAHAARSWLGLHPRGLRRLKNNNNNNPSLYEFVLYNSYKNCMNWYKNHTVVEFVLYNLYNNCMNLFVRIRTQISGKNCIQVGISTGDHYRACNRCCVCHPPHHLLRQWPFYLYTGQENTYEFIIFVNYMNS